MKHLLLLIAVFLTCQANADNYPDMDNLSLGFPDLKAKLVVNLSEPSSPDLDMDSPTASPKMDFDFFKQKTNPGVKAYKFMDDMTFVGIPLFAAGWAIKGDKAMFRVNQKAEDGGKKNTQLLTDFKTGIDDYTQFFGPAMVVGLKLGGYEGRSDWPRLLASAGMSYALMALFVNSIKYNASCRLIFKRLDEGDEDMCAPVDKPRALRIYIFAEVDIVHCHCILDAVNLASSKVVYI